MKLRFTLILLFGLTLVNCQNNENIKNKIENRMGSIYTKDFNQ